LGCGNTNYTYYDIENWKVSTENKKNATPLKSMDDSEIRRFEKFYLPRIKTRNTNRGQQHV
jgi:hypothetical protein